ncbi:MAG TPA: cytochrome c3 family protein [Labilithrix sp.]|nr:cytochrome c3 family protein [Labilithrix sp.]
MMRRVHSSNAVVAACIAMVSAGALSCHEKASGVTVTLVARADDELDLAAASWPPTATVRQVRLYDPLRLELDVDPTSTPSAWTVRVPGACPEEVRVRGTGTPPRIELKAMIDRPPEQAQVGFDAPFEIVLHAGCEAARAGHVEWRQTEGPPLELRVEESGFRLASRTLPLAATHDPNVPWGIVSFSQRTRGAYTFEARWVGDGPKVRRLVHVASAARASGIPNVALGQRVFLGGAGWKVHERPRGGLANVGGASGMASFEPDALGRWELEDDGGHALALRVGTHEGTPLDCGRSECHAQATNAAQTSPMTHVLEWGLEGRFGQTYDLRCAVACHAVGEPGLKDGGFMHVAREMNVPFPTPGPGAWERLPRALHRLGSVGCTTCHGTGFIPEPTSRWTILRADVCATCHDAPPRYQHVVAWAGSRMAASDVSPEARAGECAQCHTTAGYLAAIGVKPVRELPPQASPMGISCVACHAPHSAHEARALVREVAVSDDFVSTAWEKANRVCISCHSPSGPSGASSSVGRAMARAPFATAAAVLFQQRDRLPGAAPAPESPHAARGCIGCHATKDPSASEHGRSHTFKASAAQCVSCHAGGTPVERPGRDGTLVRERALSLLARFVARGVVAQGGGKDGAPPHARSMRVTDDGPLGRAASNVLLVVEDPAAGIHNAPYARALLDAAEAALSK